MSKWGYYDRQGELLPDAPYELLGDMDYKRVDRTQVGDVEVSTVWLGIDHNWSDEGPPLIFETMVFGGLLDEEQERYSTEQEAREGHARWVQRVAQP